MKSNDVTRIEEWQEEAIISYLCDGLRLEEIAERLKYSNSRPINSRLKLIRKKYKARTVPQLIHLWHETRKGQ
jgi:DNA-binding CsgD family transcriptional regulator